MHKITIVAGLVFVVVALMVFLLRRRQCSAPMWLSRLLVVLIVLAVFS
jgi:hypothetical protein